MFPGRNIGDWSAMNVCRTEAEMGFSLTFGLELLITVLS